MLLNISPVQNYSWQACRSGKNEFSQRKNAPNINFAFSANFIGKENSRKKSFKFCAKICLTSRQEQTPPEAIQMFLEIVTLLYYVVPLYFLFFVYGSLIKLDALLYCPWWTIMKCMACIGDNSLDLLSEVAVLPTHFFQ